MKPSAKRVQFKVPEKGTNVGKKTSFKEKRKEYMYIERYSSELLLTAIVAQIGVN